MDTFIRVATARNFNRAAVDMNISPAVVTRRIQELERSLGVKLVSRISRPLQLTSAGERYLEFCRRTIDSIVSEEAALHALQNSAQGRLTVVVPVTFGVTVLAKAHAQFVQSHPEISVSLVIADHWKETFDPSDYQADLLIRATRPKNSSLQARKIGVFNWVACASPFYLEKHGHPQAPSDLIQHSCLVPNRPFFDGQIQFRLAGSNTNVKLRGEVAPNSAVVMLYMAKAGNGVAILPLFCAKDDLLSGALVQILQQFSISNQSVWAYHGFGTRPPLKIKLYLDFVSAWMRNGLHE